MATVNLTAQRLREVLDYDPETGVLTWTTGGGTTYRGKRAGCRKGQYIVVRVDGVLYRAHRLAWLYMTGVHPAGLIDHINGDGADNRIANLRETNKTINGQNRRSGHGPTGLLGVRLDRRRNHWYAQINVNGRVVNLGRFQTPEDAHAAYLVAKRKMHDGCTI